MVQLLSQILPDNIPQLRKVLHLSAILSCAVGTHYYSDPVLLGYIFLFFSAILFGVIHYKILNISTGQSWGIALFPLSFGLLLASGCIETVAIVTAMLILAISDALAGLVGMRFARSYWVPFREQKSVLGSLVFFLSAFAILAYQFRPDTEGYWLTLIMIAFLGTGAEMFSWRGSDNFWIPVVIAVTIQYLEPKGFFPQDGVKILFFAALLLPFLVKRGWLTCDGATVAGYMGVWISLYMGYQALVFPLVFLVVGSLLSKLNEKKPASEARNALQVLANGGPAMLVALLHLPVDIFVLTFAIAMSDTVSSEVGKYFRQRTVDIITFKPITSGLSGGISWAGTLGGLLGSLLVALIGALLMFGRWGWELTVSVAVWGFVGMLVDSILGSLLQAQYRNDAGDITETGPRNQLIKGWHWCNNDVVNVLGIAVTVLLYMVL